MPRVEIEDDEEDEDYGVEIAPPKAITMVFARERESLDATLFAIGSTIFGVIVIVLLISGLLIRRLVGAGLSPLSYLARQVSTIDESNLDARLKHKGDQSIEIAPIEDQLNHLLERLQSAFEREKRFSANAAHELRTPMTSIKGYTDLILQGAMGEVADGQRHFLQIVRSNVERLSDLINDLLDTSRIEAGKISIASPLGRALLGREEGDEFVLRRPKGPATFTVVAIRYVRELDESG